MATVKFGNTSPCNSYRDDETHELVREPVEGLETSITTSEVVEGVKLTQAISEIADSYKYHSFDPPEWVWSDNPVLAQALAEEFSSDDHQVEIREDLVEE